MNTRTASGILILVTMAASSLQAAVIPGRWEKVQALEEGYAIKVKLESGEGIKASYSGFTEEGLLLKKDSGGELELDEKINQVLESHGGRVQVRDGLTVGQSLVAAVIARACAPSRKRVCTIPRTFILTWPRRARAVNWPNEATTNSADTICVSWDWRWWSTVRANCPCFITCIEALAMMPVCWGN